MAKVTEVMQLHGMRELQQALVRAPEQVTAHAGDAVAASTFAITQRAKSLVRVSTGLLQSSIIGSSRGLNGRVVIEGDAYYWRFLEYGTVHMDAKPFIRPSAEEEAKPFEQRMRNILSGLERDFGGGRLL